MTGETLFPTKHTSVIARLKAKAEKLACRAISQVRKQRTSSPSVHDPIPFIGVDDDSASTAPEARSEKFSLTGSTKRRTSSIQASHGEEKRALESIWPHERWGDARPAESLERLLPPKPVAPNSGDAARASVAAQNRQLVCDSPRTRYPENTLPQYASYHTSMLVGRSLLKRSESGIDLREDRAIKEESAVPVIRISKSRQTQQPSNYSYLNIDPFAMLPPEITSAILSYLDAASLANAERVSHRWYETAQKRHAWRRAFENEVWSTTQHTPTSHNQLRGVGLGKSIPDQDWKAMLKARRELQSRWKRGQAAAIYLEGHTDSVYCVQFDEDKIVTGSRDQTIRVWDAKTYRCLKVLGVPNRSSVSHRHSLQGDILGRPGRPTVVGIFDASKVPVNIISAEFRHTGSILCLQFDEDIMVTGSSDKTCVIWDLKADYKPVRRLRSHSAGVLDICFDEKHIVSCSKDTSICLWDRDTGGRIRQMHGHHGPVNAVQLRGDLIVSASGDGVAKLWNLTSGLCIREFASRDRGMACVDFSLDSRTILAGGNDQVIYQYDTNSGQLTRELTGHQGLVRSLYLDNVNGRIISGSYDHSVRAYDLSNGQLIVAFGAWTTSWILSAKSDYRRIVAASQDSRVVVMDFGHDVPGIKLLASG